MTSYLRDYHLSSLHSKHYRNEERDADLSGDFYSGLSGGLGLWRAVTIGVDNIQPLSYPPDYQTFVRLSGDLIITGDLHAGYMTISGDKQVGDDLDVSGDLIVEGTTLLKGATTVNNDLVLSGNYRSVGNITISGDIECDDLRVFGEQITDPSGNIRTYGIQLGGGVPIQQPAYDGVYKVGLFQRDISYNALYAEGPSIENKEQGGTGLQVYDLNTEQTNAEANNAGSISFGNRNQFGTYAVQYGKIAGLRLGNFSGGLIMKTMRTGTGVLYPALKINDAQMIKLGNIPYNDTGNTSGGVETPLTIRSSSGGNALGQHIDLQANDTGVGVQTNTLYTRTGGNNIAFYIGGDFSPTELDPSGGVLAGYFNTNGLNMNSNSITDVADPVNPNDAVNLNYLTQQVDICGGGGGGGGSDLTAVLSAGNDAGGQDISGVGAIYMDGVLNNLNGDIRTGGNLEISGTAQFDNNVNITGTLNCYDPLTIYHNPALGPGDSNPTLNFSTPTKGTSYIQMNETDGTLQVIAAASRKINFAVEGNWDIVQIQNTAITITENTSFSSKQVSNLSLSNVLGLSNVTLPGSNAGLGVGVVGYNSVTKTLQYSTT